MSEEAFIRLTVILRRLHEAYLRLPGPRLEELRHALFDLPPNHKSESDQATPQFEKHPYQRALAQVQVLTGWPAKAIFAAVDSSFEDERELVKDLQWLDENLTTADLLEDWHNAWPALIGDLFSDELSVLYSSQPSIETLSEPAICAYAEVPSLGTESPRYFASSRELANHFEVALEDMGALDAWLRRERKEGRLSESDWCETANPKPNSPRFLYNMNSPAIRKQVALYRDKRRS